MLDDTCRLSDCERKAYCRKMCKPHYETERGYNRSPAVCSACGTAYQRSNNARTDRCPPCALRTPRRLEAARNGGAARRIHWPVCVVYFKACGQCGELFTARDARPHYCSSACAYRASKPAVCRKCGAVREKWHEVCADCRRASVLANRRVSRHVRRARMKGATTEPIDPHAIYERDGWRCGICHRKVNPSLTYPNPRSASLDHIVPLARGGEHLRSNV